MYEVIKDVYNLTEFKNVTNSKDYITVSKGSQYLTFKESTDNKLGIIPVCTQNTFFDN